MTRTEQKIDPVTYEILQHRLWQITNEMGITFTRVTGSPASTEAKDFACGLYRANGDLLMISCGVLLHATSIPYGIKYIIEEYSTDPGIAEGDVFAINDPYICSVHAPDIYVITPLFHEGELIAWAAVMCHLMDTGAIDPGGLCPRATEVWHEGIRLRGIKIVERGKNRKDVWDTITNMTRDPGMMGLDLRGQIAAGRAAQKRLTDIIVTYGLDTCKALFAQVIEYAEMRIRARLQELPDGTWHTRVYYDDDGMTDKIYQVVIKMTKEKDTLTFDLTGTSEQASSSVNCGIRGGEGGVFGSVLPLIAYDMPWSAGITDWIKVIVPEGTLVCPKFPAPSSMGTIGGADAVMCGVQEVLAKMLMASGKYQEDLSAMWGSSIGTMAYSCVSQYGTPAVSMTMDGLGCGGGARSYADGVNTGGVMYIPQARVPNAETYELELPILYLYKREAIDTGGPGKWRGGASLETALTLHDAPLDLLLVPHYGRGVKSPPISGLFGGYPAANFRKAVRRNSNVQEKLRAGRIAQELDELEGTTELLPAHGVTQITSRDVLYFGNVGGGGYGDPLDRDPELVCKDVANKMVCVEAARDVYGVIINPESMKVNAKATQDKRRKLRESRVPGVETYNATIDTTGRRISEYLESSDVSGQQVIRCVKCRHVFGPIKESYKEHAIVSERPPRQAGPRHDGIEQFVLREFYCPGCATMLDVEMCRKGEPIIRDFIA